MEQFILHSMQVCILSVKQNIGIFFSNSVNQTLLCQHGLILTHVSNAVKYSNIMKRFYILYITFIRFDDKPAPVAQLVECPLRKTGGHEFDPGLRHTKVVKMVRAAPRLTLILTG